MFTLDQFKIGTKFRIIPEMEQANDMPPGTVFVVSLCEYNPTNGFSIEFCGVQGVFATDPEGNQGIHYLTEIVEILPD